MKRSFIMGIPIESGFTRVARFSLEDFCQAVFSRSGVPAEDARLSARVLVAADAMGLSSHGVGRLASFVAGFYARGWRSRRV
jgi:LDH2 family malate/lactate/ureidoglycolate dehydrogenase